MRLKIIFLVPFLLFISFLLSSCGSETDYESIFDDPETQDKIMAQMMDNKGWKHDYIDRMMGKKDTRQYLMKQPTIFFCNGPQCPQSPTAIKALLEAGYPPEKIQYYRVGMHDWITLGLPIVESKSV